MIPARYLHRTFAQDLAWWLALVVTALLAILALSLKLAAAEPDRLHKSSPEVNAAWRAAIDHCRAGHIDRAATELHALKSKLETDGDLADDGLELWQAIVIARADAPRHTIKVWNQVQLPASTRIWRDVTLAAAYLRAGDLKMAEVALDAAVEADRHHPVVHYYAALIRLEQAHTTKSWPDAIGPTRTRLVSYLPDVSPNSADMYRLAAANALDRVIEYADRLTPSEPLIPPDWTIEPTLRPTINDLLVALGAKDHLAMSHNLLAQHYLERGSADLAEHHLDHAVTLGSNVLDGYSRLSDLFESEGRNLAAARADAKAARSSRDPIGSARRFYGHVKTAWRDLVVP
jgi:tetratricopeptide (TPR) repeat protein